MKKVILFVGLALLTGGITAFADDSQRAPEHVSVILKDGSMQHFATDKVDRLCFDDEGNIVVLSGAEKSYIPLNDIDQMRFDLLIDDVSGTQGVSSELDDVAVTANAGIVTISAPEGMPLSVAVYSIKGALVFERESLPQSVTVDFSKFAHGVYIIKANNKVIKIQN